MENRSAKLILRGIGEVMQRIKKNGAEREKGLRIQVTKRILHHLRSSMHQIEDKDSDKDNKTRKIGWKPIESSICGKDHCKRDFL